MADSSSKNNPQDPAQKILGDVLLNLPAVRAAKKANTLSRVHRRLIEPIETENGDDARLAFQHTVFCQTGLPYRDPGDDVRLWKRKQGNTALEVQAGRLPDPTTREYVDAGLPWGAKPRLIMAHLNAEALRQGSPIIEIENSLTAFVKRIRGFQHGREIRAFKDQLARLSASTVRLAIFLRDDRVQGIETKVITAFDLWLHKDERQRVLWPSTIRLGHEYFSSLQEHAVPLNEADLAALAHSSMALDIYAWLAQRLHRVNPTKPAFIQWPALMQQFGPDYGRMSNFKRPFRVALRQVLSRYRAARVEVDGNGMRLLNSPPPVTKRLVILPPKPTT
jgi:Plasmid encoded RepA protein